MDSFLEILLRAVLFGGGLWQGYIALRIVRRGVVGFSGTTISRDNNSFQFWLTVTFDFVLALLLIVLSIYVGH